MKQIYPFSLFLTMLIWLGFNAKAQDYTLTPAPGMVKSLTNVSIKFNDATSIEEVEGAEITLVGPEYTANASEVGVATATMTVNLSFVNPTVDGEYTLTIPAGAFTIDGNDNEEIVANYTLSKGWVLDPTPGSVVKSFNSIVLTFPNATSVEFVGNSISFSLGSDKYIAPGINCVKDENAEIPTFNLSLIEGAQKPANGEYKFIIDAGAFLIDGEESPEIYAEYTLESEVTAEYLLDPYNGSILLTDYGVMFTIIFDEAANVSEPASTSITLTIDGTAIPSEEYMYMADGNMLMFMINPGQYCKPGKLKITIPAGAFKLSDKDSPAIDAEWEIIEPKTYNVEFTFDNGQDMATTPQSLGTILLTFPEATTAEISSDIIVPATLVEGGYSPSKYNVQGKLEVIQPESRAEGVTVAITFDPAPTKVATYTLSVKEGAIMLDKFYPSAEINNEYTNLTTGVSDIHADKNGNVTVFSIDGKAVLNNVPATRLGELEKGIYLVNGKKSVVK